MSPSWDSLRAPIGPILGFPYNTDQEQTQQQPQQQEEPADDDTESGPDTPSSSRKSLSRFLLDSTLANR